MNWLSVLADVFVILGLAAGGIGAICLVNGGMSDNAHEAAKASNDGWTIGTFGLVLITASFVLRFL